MDIKIETTADGKFKLYKFLGEFSSLTEIDEYINSSDHSDVCTNLKDGGSSLEVVKAYQNPEVRSALGILEKTTPE